MAVVDTKTIVGDIRRKVFTQREGFPAKMTRYVTLAIYKQRNAHHRLDASQVSHTQYHGVCSLMFS